MARPAQSSRPLQITRSECVEEGFLDDVLGDEGPTQSSAEASCQRRLARGRDACDDDHHVPIHLMIMAVEYPADRGVRPGSGIQGEVERPIRQPPSIQCDPCVVKSTEPIDPLLTGVAGTRLDWHQVPAGVRDAIERFLGRSVTNASSQAGGYSPALASRLALDDGTGIFVKAIAPDDVSGAPGGQGIYRREAEVAEALPDTVPAPRFTATLEVDRWVVLLFEDIIGTPPILPWQRGKLSRVLEAMATLASILTPTPISAPPASFPGGANDWATLCLDPSALEGLPGLDAWARRNVERLSDVASTAKSAHQGPTLLHTDIRADNILLTSDGVVFVDWPHAKIGAPWVDLVYFLPSVAMQGGGDPQELFWGHPLADGADRRAVCSVLASLTGFFINGATQDPPPGLPTLRKFQLAQGIAALAWLRQMMDRQIGPIWPTEGSPYPDASNCASGSPPGNIPMDQGPFWITLGKCNWLGWQRARA